MATNLEQIEMLKERANVSYAEAKETLEKFNYDLLEALIYLEAQSKVKASKNNTDEGGFWSLTKKAVSAAGSILKKGQETKFVIKKNENTVLDIPVNAAALVTIIVPPLSAAGVALALFTNHKIRFVRPDGGDLSINKTLDKVSDAASAVSSQVVEAIKKD